MGDPKQGPYGRLPSLKRILLVCPSSLVQNWAAEFKKWLGHERLKVFCLSKTSDLKEYRATSSINPVLIVSYDMVIKCSGDELEETQFDLLVCDEGHRLKNAAVKTNCALTQLGVQRRMILTGTPVQNDLQELYALIDFVNPGYLGTQSQFKKVYEDRIVRSHQSGATGEERRMGEARAAELQRITKEILLRRTAELNSKYLPPKADYVLFCRPSELQVKVYKRLVGSRLIERTHLTGLTPQHLACIDSLRKLANHPVLLWHTAKKTQESTTAHTLNLIESMCESLDMAMLRLDGQTPTGHRQKIVKQFNSPHDKTFLFLLSSKAVLFDVDWNPANDLQAMARVWRDGQKTVCHTYRLLTTGTIEEKMFQRQVKKQSLSGAVVEDCAPSTEKSQGKLGFTPEELKDIFTLDVDTSCGTHDSIQCLCGGKGGPPAPHPPSAIPSAEDGPKERAAEGKKQKRTVTMAELFGWIHMGSEGATERIPEALKSCLPPIGPVLSFVLHHYTNKQDMETKE